MLTNLLRISTRQRRWASLTALLCAFLTLLAPPASAASVAKTAVVLINGYHNADFITGADVVANLDCTGLSMSNSASDKGFTLQLHANSNGSLDSRNSYSGAPQRNGLLISGYGFNLIIDGATKINSLEIKQNADLPADITNVGTITTEGRTASVQSFQAPTNGAYLQAIKVNYTADVPDETVDVTINPASNGSMTVSPLNNGKAVKGSTLTLTATPNQGYRFEKFTVNTTDYSTNPATVTASEDLTVSASFVEDKYLVDLNYNADQGTLAVSPALPADGMVANGTKLTVTATPKSGYKLGTVTVNGTEVTSGTQITVTGNTTIAATFAEEVYQASTTVDIQIPQVEGNPAPGSVTLTQNGAAVSSIKPGDVLTVTVTPAVGFNSGNTVRVGNTNVSLAAAPANRAAAAAGPTMTGTYTFKTSDLNFGGKLVITPTFTVQQYTVTYTTGIVGGSFTARQGSSTIANNGKVNFGSTILIYGTPNAGYELGTCTVNGTALTNPNSDGSYSFTINGDVEIGGSFTQKSGIRLPFSIADYSHGTVTAKIQGQSSNLTNTDYVSPGDVIEISVAPDAEWQLKSLDVSGTALTVNNPVQAQTYTWTVPAGMTANVVVSAVFEEIHPELIVTWNTLQPNAGGTFKVMHGSTQLVDGANKVRKDEEISIVVTPAASYMVPAVTINGQVQTNPVQASDGTYTYSYTVLTDVSINVSFTDNREQVQVLLCNFNATQGRITLYSDAACTKALVTSTYTGAGSAGNVTWLQLRDKVYAGTTIYGKVTPSGNNTATVYVGDKSNPVWLTITDNKFDFTVGAAKGQAMTLTAIWEAVAAKYSVSYTTTPSDAVAQGMGSVILDAVNVEAGFTSGSKFDAGTTITGTIKAADGFKIDRVYGLPGNTTWTNNSAQSLTERTFSFTLSSNVNFTITYAVIPTGTLTYTINNLNPGTQQGQDAIDKIEGLASYSVTYNGASVNPATTVIREGQPVEVGVIADAEYYVTALTTSPASTGAAVIAPNKQSATATVAMPRPTGNPARAQINIMPRFAHRTLTVDWTLNSADQVPTGMVTVTGKKAATTGNGSTTGAIANSQAGVWTASDLTFTAKPVGGYKVTGMTIAGSDGTTVTATAEMTGGTNQRPTGNYVATVTTPASNGTDNQKVTYTVTLTMELLPVKVYLTTPTGANNHGTVTLVNTNDGNAEIPANVAAGTDVKVGSLLNLRVVANTGYQVASVTINGRPQEIPLNESTVNINGIKITDVTRIAVTYEQKKYQVTVGYMGDGMHICADPYINNATTGSAASFTQGTRITLYANVRIGYRIVRWLLNGSTIYRNAGTANQTEENGNTLAVTVTDQVQNYTVVCERITYKEHYVTVQTNHTSWGAGETWGTVEFSYVWKDQNLNQVGVPTTTSTTVYSEPGVVTMKATPNPAPAGRYTFVRWQTTAPASTYTIDPADPTVVTYGSDNNATFTAVFGRNWEVTYKPETDYIYGTLELRNPAADDALIGPNGIFVANGSRITAVATPDHGYRVACWIINGREQQVSSSVNMPVTQTFTINADTQIGVRFYDPNAKPPTSGIEGVDGDNAAEAQWFTIQGRYLGTEQPTAAGIYIKREGSKATKVVVR